MFDFVVYQWNFSEVWYLMTGLTSAADKKLAESVTDARSGHELSNVVLFLKACRR